MAERRGFCSLPQDTPGICNVLDATLTSNNVPTLRISHTASHVVTTLEGEHLSHERPFSFTLSAQDAEDIRWYLEDYRIYPVEPQPKTAQRIERRMGEVGDRKSTRLNSSH